MGNVRTPEYLQGARADEWHLNKSIGNKELRPYPVAPIIYHDKVIPHPFWGATNYKEVLSWNLLFGTMLNYSGLV